MIVVLDTNIVASATFWRGSPSRCLEAWAQGAFTLVISHPILAEYEEVIARLAARYPNRPAVDWLGAIRQAAHLCFPVPQPAATSDPDDQMFIECAITARADYLVSGDKGHLLALQQAGGIPIIAVADFLRRLDGDSARSSQL
jgi:putative PIN family toxin of toxin-antitoxin system